MHASKVSRRLTQATAPEVNELIYRPRLDGFTTTFLQLGDINKAHIVMLAEQGLLRPEHAAALARAVVALEAAGANTVPLDPSREDAYFNYEAHLISMVGSDIGGRLHIGRSRNDILATLDRLRAREVLLKLVDAVLAARTAALENAERYAEVVMPGYTHLQPAQPMTYGFYLAGVAQALARDSGRLVASLENLNVSPLGAAAFAGTPFAIDRERTAALLGFDGVLENTLDAVASRDFVLESLSGLSVLAVLWSRVAQDYYVWSTYEFSLIEFPDSVASTSSIMPQKKNPVVLEHLKGRAGHIVALFMSCCTAIKGTHFTHSGDANREGTRPFWEAAQEALSCLRLLTLVLQSARPNQTLGLRRANADFSTVTALADLIVSAADVSFRDAHHIVGEVVRKVMDQGKQASEITSTMLDEAATAQLGRPLLLDAARVEACLNATSNVQARHSQGAPGLSALSVAIKEAKQRLDVEQALNAARHERFAHARQKLDVAISALSGESLP